MRIELEDAKLDEIDLEGVLGFAEHVLTNAARLWMEASPEQNHGFRRFCSQGTDTPGRQIWNRRIVYCLHTVSGDRRRKIRYGVPDGIRTVLHRGNL